MHFCARYINTVQLSEGGRVRTEKRDVGFLIDWTADDGQTYTCFFFIRTTLFFMATAF